MNLPYRWFPNGAHPSRKPPAPGEIVALDHTAYEVESISAVPRPEWTEEDWELVHRYGSSKTPLRVILRRVSGPDKGCDELHHFTARGDIEGGTSGGTTWNVYEKRHWSACGRCGEPSPCREVCQERYIAARMERMNRYATPGVCPACSEPVTDKQKSITFADNIETPVGPPVTYHVGRVGCRLAALEYQKAWKAAADGREEILAEEEPYSGTPNPTQRHLLALAADGLLACHSTLVHRAVDSVAVDADASDPMWEVYWYPSGLTRAQARYLQPLITAGLIAPPAVAGAHGGREGVYRLTAEGHKAHRRYPAPQEGK